MNRVMGNMFFVTKLSRRGAVCNLRFCPSHLSSVGEIYLYSPGRSTNRGDNFRGGLQPE